MKRQPNPIERLFAEGFAARVLQKARRTESYYAGKRLRTSDPDGLGPMEEELKTVIETLRETGADGGCWLTITGKGNLIGEMILRAGEDAPTIVWSVSSAGIEKCAIRFENEVPIRFPSESDLLAAGMEPQRALQLAAPASAEAVLALVGKLGYALDWAPRAQLFQSVSEITLKEAE